MIFCVWVSFEERYLLGRIDELIHISAKELLIFFNSIFDIFPSHCPFGELYNFFRELEPFPIGLEYIIFRSLIQIFKILLHNVQIRDHLFIVHVEFLVLHLQFLDYFWMYTLLLHFTFAYVLV